MEWTTDVAIIGAGPAGMTAGLYCARAGVTAVIFEGELIGGQASTTDSLENYPGFPHGIGGPDLMMKFDEQVRSLGVTVKNQAVRTVDLKNRTVSTRRDVYKASAIIIASGAARKKLGVVGEDQLVGRGVSYCATCDGALYKGKSVCVIGGGNTAVEDAIYLANVCQHVTLIHRRNAFRAQAHLVDRLKRIKNVSLSLDSVVNAIEPTEVGVLLSITNVKTDQSSAIDCAGCFVAIGTSPNTDLFTGEIALDDGGYIVAGEDTHTALPGIYIAGDIRSKPLRQVVTAVSDGAVAATEAVKFIHNL